MASESNDITHLKKLREQGVPIVFFDRVSERLNAVKVITNDLESAYGATKHLITKGAKNIAYLSYSLNISVDQKRMQGYLKAIEDHNFRQEQKILIRCTTNDEENKAIIRELLLSPKKPDAIFASVERLAISTYFVCKELCITIPKELKVLSFSNLPTAPLLDPPLTTVSQPAYEIGKSAAKILVNSLKKNSVELETERIVIPSVLIERESSIGIIG